MTAVPARIAAALVALALLPPTSALAAEPRAQLPDIEDEVMCPVCGTTLELAEAAPQAERQRELIRGLIDEGMTKDEIKDRLVDEYGEEVLATPPSDGFGLAAWVVPGLGVGVALIAIAVVMVRVRRREGDRDAPETIDPADADRLERELDSYDA
jgi:cytochrome c-type biogenesis protein CcmH